MKKTSEVRGGSYKIFQDVNLAQVDPHYTVIDVAAASREVRGARWREMAGLDPI